MLSTTYWFLQPTIDLEYKYYILMGYLQRIKESFSNTGFEKSFKHILVIKRDLISFIKKNELSQRTLGNMTEQEKEEFNRLLEMNSDNIDYIHEIVRNSIETIDNFLEKNKDVHKKYNSLVDVESYTSKQNYWDQGFLILRKNGEEFMRIFNWFFSIIKIGDKENLALLMTELLEPACTNTKDISKIKKFLKDNIKDFSNKYDSILVGDISNDVDIEIGIEIGKKKSIGIIMDHFKKNSSSNA